VIDDATIIMLSSSDLVIVEYQAHFTAYFKQVTKANHLVLTPSMWQKYQNRPF